MANKKKLSNIFYMFLLVASFVIFFGNSQVNATVNIEELQQACNQSIDNYNEYYNTNKEYIILNESLLTSYLTSGEYFCVMPRYRFN